MLVNGQSADRLRETWEARALRHARGKFGAALVGVLFNEYAEKMPVLLRAAFPGFRDVALPAFTGYATVLATGVVVCDMFDRERVLHHNVPVFDTEQDMIKQFRDLADNLKLDDAERIALTEMVKRWVVADLRVNHMGVKVA